MLRHGRFALFVVLVVAIAAASSATLAVAGNGPLFRVTVTNLTRSQILSPPVVVVHDGEYALFTPGEPASSELAQLAEDAMEGPLLALLGTIPEVSLATVGGGGVPPGESLTIDVAARGRFDSVSVVGMLVTTNDAFYAATLSATHARGKREAYALAWDAGSEANTEECAHIPGPPCFNGGVRVTDGAEGFVHVHGGVHGHGQLAAETYDWRNPAALVTVERIR